MIILQQPPKVVFGVNSSKSIPEDVLIHSSNKILLLIAEPLMSVFQDIQQTIIKSGKNLLVIPYKFPGEPTFSQFDEMLSLSVTFDPDCVIGVGGGSVLDSAKLLAAMTGNDQQYPDVVGVGLLKTRMKKLICVPTTSGTGSEVSPIAILLNEKTDAKSGIVSQALLADAAYIDPQMTVGLPPKFTAETGMDALCHCVEAYTNQFAHPAVDVYALKGIQLIADNLLKAFQDGSDMEARSAMSLASMYGGLCLGPVNTHAVHALSYGLAGKFHVSHGLANAVLLPSVLRFNMDANPARHAHVALALGAQPGKDDTETALRGIAIIEELSSACGIPAGLKALGVEENDLPDLASIAMGVTRLLKNNPKPLNREDAISIYQTLI